MSAGSPGTRRIIAAPIVALALAAVDARADGGLDGLRLFLTPERRAALDGETSADGPPSADVSRGAPDATARAGSPASSPAGAGRASATGRAPRAATSAPDRPGAPPPGSATLRSSRGTSRIVDGLPLPEGPT